MLFTELPQSTHDIVVLRPMLESDIQAWYDYLSQPIVFEPTSWNVQCVDELAHAVWKPETFTDSTALRFAIALRSTNMLVGTAGFHTVSALNKAAELAYDLAPLVWGQGIAQSACRALVQWAHEHVGMVRVQASVLESNARSAQVLQRCGFEREGLLRSYRMVRGRPGDFCMYGHVVVAGQALPKP